MNISLKTLGIIAIGFFVVMGILTFAIAETEDEEEEKQETTEKVERTDKGEKKESSGVVITEADDTDPYQELDELIGLTEVKDEVKQLANFVRVQNQRKQKGLKTPKLSYHLIFTGNPGTGKTTVARIVARIYKDLGILKRGHLVETDRSGLVGKYVGQTAPKTNALVDSAMNGVLFIDEAYALTPDDRTSDYGQEAIATLLKRMEDNRDSLVVIIAGYTKEMERFIQSNPGLQSRFTRYIHFPDYTCDELVQIFELYTKKNEYKISNDAKRYVKKAFDAAIRKRDRNFGNARYARNMFERSIQCQANRLSKKNNCSEEELTTITLEDVRNAFGYDFSRKEISLMDD